MLASNLNVASKVRTPAFRQTTRQASLDFLANFRQHQKPNITLRTENIGPKEPAYLITELPNGTFKIYGIDCPRVRDNKTAFTDEERKSVIDAMPFEEQFVSIERSFVLEANEETQEITVLLGEEWLFAIWVDEKTETFMIERNQYLDMESDISPMIRTVGLAMNQAKSI